MNKRTPIALVAALLLSGITAAAAAGMTQALPSDTLRADLDGESGRRRLIQRWHGEVLPRGLLLGA
jgi:hypothetical protein